MEVSGSRSVNEVWGSSGASVNKEAWSDIEPDLLSQQALHIEVGGRFVGLQKTRHTGHIGPNLLLRERVHQL